MAVFPRWLSGLKCTTSCLCSVGCSIIIYLLSSENIAPGQSPPSLFFITEAKYWPKHTWVSQALLLTFPSQSFLIRFPSPSFVFSEKGLLWAEASPSPAPCQGAAQMGNLPSQNSLLGPARIYTTIRCGLNSTIMKEQSTMSHMVFKSSELLSSQSTFQAQRMALYT